MSCAKTMADLSEKQQRACHAFARKYGATAEKVAAHLDTFFALADGKIALKDAEAQTGVVIFDTHQPTLFAVAALGALVLASSPPAISAPPVVVHHATLSHYDDWGRETSWPGHHFGDVVEGRVIIGGPRHFALKRFADVTYHGVTLHAVIGDRTDKKHDGRWDIPLHLVRRLWGETAVSDGLLDGTVRVHALKKRRHGS